MKQLGVAGRVSVERVAVVQSVRLPRLLVLGKVPASGKLGFQSLCRIKHIKSSQVKKERNENMTILPQGQREVDQSTHPDFPQQITDDVESRYPGRGSQWRVAAVSV